MSNNPLQAVPVEMSEALRKLARDICTGWMPAMSKEEFIASITSIFRALEEARGACERDKYHLHTHKHHPDQFWAAKIGTYVEEKCHRNHHNVAVLQFWIMVEMGRELSNHTDNGAAGAGP